MGYHIVQKCTSVTDMMTVQCGSLNIPINSAVFDISYARFENKFEASDKMKKLSTTLEAEV